jgi:hypothetical protein
MSKKKIPFEATLKGEDLAIYNRLIAEGWLDSWISPRVIEEIKARQRREARKKK